VTVAQFCIATTENYNYLILQYRSGTFSWSNSNINTALLFVVPCGLAVYKLNKIQYSLELHPVSLL